MHPETQTGAVPAGPADSEAVRAPPPLRRLTSPGALDVAVALGLFLAALAVYWTLVRAADVQQLLTGEEASVSLRDPIGIDEHYQFSTFATNFGAHLHFWLWAHLDPSFDVFYGRRWKALVLALLAPLAFLTLRRRLDCDRPAAALGGGAVAALPGVAAFSWLAIESGLEAVWGLAALYVVTSRRRGWWLAGVLAGVCVSVYGGGLAWAGGAGAAALWRVARSQRRLRDALLAATGAVAGLAVVLFPIVWWRNTHAIVRGGGTETASAPLDNLADLWRGLGVHGSSYYDFTAQPALVAVPVVLLVLLALPVVAARRPQSLPWLLVAVLAVGLYAVAGGVLGIRRAVALPVVAGLVLGLLADVAARRAAAAPRRVRPLAWTAPVVVAGIIAWATVDDLRMGGDLRAGRTALPHDFAFPIDPGATMPAQLDGIAQQLRSGGLTPEQAAGRWEAERTFAALWMLGRHRDGSTSGLPSRAEIVRFAREGPRCTEGCDPVPGRP